MYVWGLHILDLSIVIGFLIAILVVGVWVSRGVKHEADFFLGGRKMGKALQFFLSFGNATDSSGAVQISSEVFRQGMGGIWLNFQALFITPFFWFTQVWFRRIRLTTMADLFVDRFGSKPLATVYSLFSILIALLTLGSGNLVTYKVTAAMVVKPESAYTAEDHADVERWHEYKTLQTEKGKRKLTDQENNTLDELEARNARGQLRSFITYVPQIPFYVAYSAIIAVYIMLGGLKAAAITDTIQGLLILIMSIILIPLGLHHIGGFTGLHERVPEFRFAMVGTPQLSEYTWYAIGAITFTSLIQIFGLMHNMSIGGSARDEDTARFGMISGGFTKRLVLMGWAFCGLLAIAILTGDKALADSDNAWGQLSRELLPHGLMGIMLAGLMLGHMPAVGVACVSVSGLFTRNVYRVLFPGKSETHYTRVGQISIAAILILSILPALFFTGVMSILSEQIAFNAYFGAAVFLVFFWRRLTARAVLLGVLIWVVLIGVIPLSVSRIDSLSHAPSLLIKTTGGTPCFFEKIVRSDVTDPNSPLMGAGRFQVEAYLLHLLQLPVERFAPAHLKTTRWLFDGLFPFVMMIVFSLFTSRGDRLREDRFYVKLKTPVAPTPEEDAIEVQKSFDDPHRFDDQKLFPGSTWEFTKWNVKDVVGFFGCWAIVGAILMLLKLLVTVGSKG